MPKIIHLMPRSLVRFIVNTLLLLIVSFRVVAQFASDKSYSIPPTVVKLDADEIQPFYNGFAVVKKGNKTAVINNQGRLIVPYGNRYEFPLGRNYFIPTDEQRSSTDYFVFQDGSRNELCFITTSGVVHRLANMDKFASRFNDEGKALAFGRSNGMSTSIYLVDSMGKTKLLRNVYAYASDNQHLQNVNIPYPESFIEHPDKLPTYAGRLGYVNSLTGQFVIQPQFNKAEPFFEGLAAVMKLDEFGKEQWGFIDLKGSMIIPFRYSNQPSNFSDGLALVTPVDQTEFDYAFINKKGEIQIKLNTREYDGSGSRLTVRPFECGITYFGRTYVSEVKVMDTTGKVFSLRDFLRTRGLEFAEEVKNIHVDEIQQGFMYIHAESGMYGTLAVDLVNTRHQHLSQQEVVERLNYDAITGLRHYKIWNRANAGKANEYTEGYINANYEFVIIKGEPQKW